MCSQRRRNKKQDDLKPCIPNVGAVAGAARRKPDSGEGLRLACKYLTLGKTVSGGQRERLLLRLRRNFPYVQNCPRMERAGLPWMIGCFLSWEIREDRWDSHLAGRLFFVLWKTGPDDSCRFWMDAIP